MDQCPYCYKRFKVVPDHLGKTPKCRVKHADALKGQLRKILDNHKARTAKGEGR